ncbi:sigma-70 family RNA polymerase sigma factor [Rhizobium sp. CNPSo 4062]|uniref:sigma-70 family RNA polymerase sigma factor n=1 Tax=Rhizobium sp. CNPSo 4062 TaxID=3021410 RepID=UPI00254C3ED8|nr:sigma-70 family RNA polymerase sigma factor [Rhizobium sp. CNPSo 4062]MDK4702671.1 sigma-70 family RNA polymerase sigma factor [Rhizobium sp. CNPSo 4062]
MTDARLVSSTTLGGQLPPWTWHSPQNTAISRFARFLARLRNFIAEAKPGNHAIQMVVAQSAAGAEPLKLDESMRRFQQTIIPHLDAAYNFARFLSRDADAAQDIVQEAYLRAYRGFGGFRDGDARAWTFTIVRNCYHAWLQEGRRKTRYEQPMTDERDSDEGSPSPDPASEEDTPEAAFIRKSETQRVREVINRLPDAMREVLVLRELEDLSYKEIAEIIDAPIGTVMSRLARARRDFGEVWRSLEGKGAAP